MTGDSPPTDQDAGRNADRITEAYRSIRNLILFDRLSPGTPIIQTRIAQWLSHSRATLRAALQRLAQEGYVVETELGTYSRFVVASLTVEDMQELFSIIGALEGLAARHCAQLEPDVREELVERMENLNARMLQMAKDGDLPPEEASSLDTELHKAFVGAAPGTRLQTHLATIRPQCERYRDLYSAHSASSMRTLAAPEHQAIVNAIRSGDPDCAQKAVEEHWRAGSKRLQEMIGRLGERRGYLE